MLSCRTLGNVRGKKERIVVRTIFKEDTWNKRNFGQGGNSSKSCLDMVRLKYLRVGEVMLTNRL